MLININKHAANKVYQTAILNKLIEVGYTVTEIDVDTEYTHDIDITEIELQSIVDQVSDSKTRRFGMLLGYPECCIEDFCTKLRVDNPEINHDHIFMGSGYMPCPKCIKRNPSELVEEINKNRWIKYGQFPHPNMQILRSGHRHIIDGVTELENKIIRTCNQNYDCQYTKLNPPEYLVNYQNKLDSILHRLGELKHELIEFME